VATDYGGRKGIPLLLDRSVWQLAQSIQGDQGARVLVRAQPDRVALVDAIDWGTDLDVDTPAQYEQAAALIEQSGIQPGRLFAMAGACPVP
jgi:CTP:molybdopterin cytidylyltransferase MocA